HEVALGVVAGDRVGDRLQHHRLSGLRRGDDETALALADRGDEVDDPRGEDVRLGLQAQALLRVERGELVEVGPVASLLRVHPVDGVEADQGVELLAPLALARLAHRAGDDVALAQAVAADLGERDVHVVAARKVAAGPDEGVVVEDVEDAGDRDEDVVLADHGLGAVEAVTAAAAAALPEPAPAAAAAAVVVAVAPLVAAALVAPAAAVGGAVVTAVVAAVVAVAAVAVAVSVAVVAVAVTPLAPAAALAPALTALAPRLALVGVGGGLGRLCGLFLLLGDGLHGLGLSGRGSGGRGGGRLGGLLGGLGGGLRGGFLGSLGTGTFPARPGGPLRGGRRFGRGGGLGGGSRRAFSGTATLLLLDGRDELALPHPPGPADAELGSDLLQLGQHLGGQAGAGATRAGLGRGAGGGVAGRRRGA